MFQKIDALLREVIREFGLPARLVAWIGGPWLFRKLKAESQRSVDDVVEPPTFYEKREATPLLPRESSPAIGTNLHQMLSN